MGPPSGRIYCMAASKRLARFAASLLLDIISCALWLSHALFRIPACENNSSAWRRYEMTDLQGHGPGLAATSRAMSGYFASFARRGAPTAHGQPAWPHYETETRAVMLLDSRCRVAMDPDGEERRFWRSLGWT
jgi:Carboxylesterase family